MSQTIFLTWIEHQRTRNIAARLNLSLAELTTRDRGLKRYARLIPETLRVLRTRRPRSVIVQAPSQVLALITLLLRPFFGYRLILDAHNEAVEPYLHRSWWVLVLTRWLLRRADRIIVSNRQLADVVQRVGGRALVLPDALPTPPTLQPRRLPGPRSVVVISTYAGDEPFAEVVEAARALRPSVHFHVTGNDAKCPPSTRARVPDNMTLTGFLSEHEYWNLLASCDAVIDLTTMDNCLVCGAYESVALGKPVLLSRNEASIEVFGGLADFTENTSADIARGISQMLARNAAASNDAPRRAFEERWAAHARALTSYLSE